MALGADFRSKNVSKMYECEDMGAWDEEIWCLYGALDFGVISNMLLFGSGVHFVFCTIFFKVSDFLSAQIKGVLQG